MLDNRKKKILQAIVEEYIDTAEPVSSGNLVKELNCSSATIRNDMAELEKIGFLEKPYTSAGRIPSQKGYRYYIDELLRDDKLTAKEMQYIKNKLETTVNELEDLTKIATTTLSELTHYTTIAIGPKIETHTILDVKFVLLGSRVMMAIILTDSGIIREAIIKFDEDVTEEQIKNLNTIFANHMVGKPIDELGGNIEEFITNEMKNSISIIQKIIDEINKIFKEHDDLILEGTNKAFDLPEFQKAELAKNFMNVLDAKDLVSEVLNTGVAEDINVYIGEELQDEKLKDFSVVTFNHLLGDKDIGTIGIIGPTRMDYSKVISIMKYISKKLKEDHDE
ncbi:MAG: heat-inducible transcription repressor HrcA [Clostridia bacterium]|jgi:heat-inducible transcriptional repressor|nr:heat-inducible transcription repressor HrcA [Clostridia bacterium]